MFLNHWFNPASVIRPTNSCNKYMVISLSIFFFLSFYLLIPIRFIFLFRKLWIGEPAGWGRIIILLLVLCGRRKFCLLYVIGRARQLIYIRSWQMVTKATANRTFGENWWLFQDPKTKQETRRKIVSWTWKIIVQTSPRILKHLTEKNNIAFLTIGITEAVVRKFWNLPAQTISVISAHWSSKRKHKQNTLSISMKNS